MAILLTYIGRMPFLALTLDSADPFFSLVLKPGFYLHHAEVTDEDPACGSPQADKAGRIKI